MKYSTKTGTLAEITTGALVTGFKTARRIVRTHKQGALFDAATADFIDDAGKSLTIRLPRTSPIRRIIIAGGADDEQTETQFRKMTSSAVTALKGLPTPNAIWALTATTVSGRDAYWKTSSALNALSTGLYEFNEHKSGGRDRKRISLRVLHMYTDARSKKRVQHAVRLAQALKSGLDLARDSQ